MRQVLGVRPAQRSNFWAVLVMRYFFPSILVIWLLFFAFAKSSTANSSFRGSLDSTPLQAVAAGYSENSQTDGITDHAIIVAGHAVMRLGKISVADKSDSGWYLLPYQENQGFPEIIGSHIKKGIEILQRDDNALLIFSGGQTRKDVGPASEGASYYYLAKEKRWLSNSMSDRVYLEEYARDSFENLLFSLCRFREVTGSYPRKVSVIGFDFKSDRFTSLHRRAIGFPSSNFSYIGLRPLSPKFDHIRAESGEKVAAASFMTDMYGCSNPALADKRESRNPFRRTIPYELACPELKELLKWCGPELFPREGLPW